MTAGSAEANAPTELTRAANKVLALFFASSAVTSAWMGALFFKALDEEWELRNRIFCIMISGLVETGQEYGSRINGIRHDCRRAKLPHHDHYLDIYDRYIKLLWNLLETISREEMIFIKELRNQWLHGRWDEINKDKRRFHYVKNGLVIAEKLPWRDYSEIFHSLLPSDDTISRIRQRFTEQKTFFWTVDRVICGQSFRAEMRRDFFSPRLGVGPRAYLRIPNTGYVPPEDSPNEFFASLMDLAPLLEDLAKR